MNEWLQNLRLYLIDVRNKPKIKLGILISLLILGSVVIITQTRNTTRLSNVIYIDTVAMSIEQRAAKLDLDVPYYNKKVQLKTISFYRRNKNATKWLTMRKPTASYTAFVDAVRKSAAYGMNPDHYDLRSIRQRVKEIYEADEEPSLEALASLDLRITESFFLFTTHIIEGRIRTLGNNHYVWKRMIDDENDVKLLANNSADKLESAVQNLHPKHEQYDKLRESLAYYRRLEEQGAHTLAALNLGGIKPGLNHPLIPEIRRRLLLTDLEPYPMSVGDVYYDDQLLEGIKQFQRRHGLVADGIISETTLKYLNQPFKEKADLIELNLERLRWLPSELGSDYISINVPEYMMRVYHDNTKKVEMRVVLGTQYNATPIFTDTLEYVVFSPTWHIPQGIIEDEAIPNLIEDPEYYDKERFKIYKKGKLINPKKEDWMDEDIEIGDYQIVENPGPGNSLGRVKFIMPNNFSVYLHDTPADHLFSKNKRAYSHGCIRLEKPEVLAEYLLRDQPDWNTKAIARAMESTEPITVHLKKDYPVMIEYRTVWVDDEGHVNFRDDVYGHDKRQLAQLNKLK
jgi:murein L,D-transpeptidase YcbB/YkuD